MIKRFCDKCEKELGPGENVFLEIDLSGKCDNHYSFELCEGCARSFGYKPDKEANFLTLLWDSLRELIENMF